MTPDKLGHFGIFGGKFVPETLMAVLSDLEKVFTYILTSKYKCEHLEATYQELKNIRPDWFPFAASVNRVKYNTEQLLDMAKSYRTISDFFLHLPVILPYSPAKPFRLGRKL